MIKPSDITAIKEKHCKTGKQLAELLGVTPATISYWEAGKRYPRRKMQQRLEELQCEPAESLN